MKALLLWLRAGFHTTLLFVLPWVVGAVVGLAFDVDEVSETGSRFATFFAFVAVPLMVLQLAAIVSKVRRELRADRTRGNRGFAGLGAAVDRHARVLTHRGLTMAVASLGMVVLALIAKWGQFGVLAVAGLGLMYLASTYASLISAFSVRDFDARTRVRRGVIERRMSRPLVEAGDTVEERFVLERVPIPFFFRLHIDEALPLRLGGDTRFALDRTVSKESITVSAPLPRTPRGLYRLGPASIWYEDVLGLTRVFVATQASASFRALPRLRPLVFDRKPKSLARAEGTLSVLSKLATEDHFKTRPYAQGDDRRRVHWKRSINAGELIVRVPEAVPFAPTRVRIFLDTYLPPMFRVGPDAKASEPLEDVLDLLVETWIALAQMLVRRHESVSVICPVREDDRVELREMTCKRGEERKWRAVGSEAAWQKDISLAQALANATHEPSSVRRPVSSIVVSAGLEATFPRLEAGGSIVLADGASVVPLSHANAPSRLERMLTYDYPVGAEDSRLDLERLFEPKPQDPDALRVQLARATNAAVASARASSASVVVVRRHGSSLMVSES